MTKNPSKSIKTIDLTLYGTGIALGLLIAVGDTLFIPQVAPPVNDNYMDRILLRMDSVSAQLNRWEAFDVSHHSR